MGSFDQCISGCSRVRPYQNRFVELVWKCSRPTVSYQHSVTALRRFTSSICPYELQSGGACVGGEEAL